VSTGRRIFNGICNGGAQSAGRGGGAIAVGEWADLLSLDASHIDLLGLRGDTILDSFTVAGDNRMVADVWSSGRHMVKAGRHVHRQAITAAYSDAVSSLRDGL